MPKIRLSPGLPVSVYVASDDLTVTKEWVTCSQEEAEALLGSKYKGRSLVEVEELDAGKAEEETPSVTFEIGDQEGESYAEI